MKACGVVDVEIHVFLTSALVGGEQSVSIIGRLQPGIDPLYPLDKRLGSPRTSLNDKKRRKFLSLPGLKL
jgi:hypothetical protein